jgi:hypothetical protein
MTNQFFAFLGDLLLRRSDLSADSGEDHASSRKPEPLADLATANLITSVRRSDEGLKKHALLLDLDVPHVYLPSSTPGHGHLMIDLQLNHREWETVMLALADAEVLEKGYVDASIARGYSALRLPWIKKAPPEPAPEPSIFDVLEPF